MFLHGEPKQKRVSPNLIIYKAYLRLLNPVESSFKVIISGNGLLVRLIHCWTLKVVSMRRVTLNSSVFLLRVTSQASDQGSDGYSGSLCTEATYIDAWKKEGKEKRKKHFAPVISFLFSFRFFLPFFPRRRMRQFWYAHPHNTRL